jgi:Flp pilus assembly protein TadG
VDWSVRARGLELLTMGYHYRRPRRDSRGNPVLETALAIAVLAVIVVTAILFLFVYHDIPLRVS